MEWSAGHRIAVGFVMAVAFGMLVPLVLRIQKIEDFKKKSTDVMSAWFGILGVLSNASMAAAFGKPYTPMYISGGTFLAALFIGFIWNGLWDWLLLIASVLTPFLVGGVYFIWGIRDGGWS